MVVMAFPDYHSQPNRQSQIFINEERFCTYAHRLEPHDLHGIQIGGDVEITGIQIF